MEANDFPMLDFLSVRRIGDRARGSRADEASSRGDDDDDDEEEKESREAGSTGEVERTLVVVTK